MVKTYSDKLKLPAWQKKRLKILERDNWTCKYCGHTDTELHVHHTEYDGEPWDVEDNTLETVCKCCHLAIESLKDCKIIEIQRGRFLEEIEIVLMSVVYESMGHRKGIIYEYNEGELITVFYLSDNTIKRFYDIIWTVNNPF